MRMLGVIEDSTLPARYGGLRLTLYSRTGNCPPAPSITTGCSLTARHAYAYEFVIVANLRPGR